jgi:hypothetical protein
MPSKHGAMPYLLISSLYVNLWKCESDISHERLGTLFKFLVQTERARVGERRQCKPRRLSYWYGGCYLAQ